MSVAKRKGFIYAGKVLRKALGLTSMFRIPEQGMKEYEVLSRSSVFFVRSRHPKKQYHLLSTAHVTHPFNFPQLYPEQYSWLSFVKEKHTKNLIQFRELETGRVLDEFEVENKTYPAPDNDLVVMHLRDEEAFLAIMREKYDLEIDEVEYVEDDTDVTSEESVCMIGNDFTQDGNEQEVLVPAVQLGQITSAVRDRYYIQTEAPSVMGMCGAPVLLLDKQPALDWESAVTKRCIGMVEGLVQPVSEEKLRQKSVDVQKALKAIENNTAVLGSRQILEFVKEVEQSLDKEEQSEEISGKTASNSGSKKEPFDPNNSLGGKKPWDDL